MWIVDLRSKQTKRVATGGFASWLADGKTVCYRTSVDGKFALQSLDVTDDKATPKTLLTGFSGFYPAISPDGQYVAGFGNSELQIWSVAKKEIVDRYPLPGWGGFLPSWSPDSQRIGFGSFAEVVANDLWIYDLRTHQAKRLLAGPYTLPRWSADGKRMCVDRRHARLRELWLLDLPPSVLTVRLRRRNSSAPSTVCGLPISRPPRPRPRPRRNSCWSILRVPIGACGVRNSMPKSSTRMFSGPERQSSSCWSSWTSPRQETSR